ncbi:DinB family protein [Tsukamurella sp. 8F]|uniref:DinB family protein n=1 Tax=unclassified Tsukamurella TaxID=2633480 RepID=UPI0023B93F1F|nr:MULTISPECIES: DinB family protein [unclassified Tsukamurella]MDF0529990.1 DinB family protein [Tsukamurella sp. 8J]MDF0587238.1 DinB family protein [Tsukamurella sp. 8F]
MAEDSRIHPPQDAGERASLLAFLDYQRATLAMKCGGLAEDQLKQRAVPTSGLTLLGLVRHMAAVESSWFVVALDGADARAVWEGDVDEDFRVESADVVEAFGRWGAACDASRDVLTRLPELDHTVEYGGERYSVRYVLLHMIEEYARHNGHADLLREAVDGRVGE